MSFMNTHKRIPGPFDSQKENKEFHRYMGPGIGAAMLGGINALAIGDALTGKSPSVKRAVLSAAALGFVDQSLYKLLMRGYGKVVGMPYKELNASLDPMMYGFVDELQKIASDTGWDKASTDPNNRESNMMDDEEHDKAKKSLGHRLRMTPLRAAARFDKEIAAPIRGSAKRWDSLSEEIRPAIKSGKQTADTVNEALGGQSDGGKSKSKPNILSLLFK